MTCKYVHRLMNTGLNNALVHVLALIVSISRFVIVSLENWSNLPSEINKNCSCKNDKKDSNSDNDKCKDKR